MLQIANSLVCIPRCACVRIQDDVGSSEHVRFGCHSVVPRLPTPKRSAVYESAGGYSLVERGYVVV